MADQVEIPQPLTNGTTDHTDESQPAQAPPLPAGAVAYSDSATSATPPPLPAGAKSFESTVPPTPPAPSSLNTIKNRVENFIGGLVPQAAAPALQYLKENVSDPLNKFGEDLSTGAEEAGKVPGEALSFIKNFNPANSGYGPVSVEDVSKTAAREHPVLSGVGGGVGKFVGSMASPTNLAIIAAMPEAEAYPMLSKALATGFAVQMGTQEKEAVQNLRDNWGTMSPEERYESMTDTGLQGILAAAATLHAADTLRGEKGEAAPNKETAPKAKGGQTTIRPTTKQIAGIEAPITALQQDEVSPVAKVAAHFTTPGKAAAFQKEATAPAATRQLTSSVGQIAEDKIAAHQAIMNGERTTDAIAGTQTPSKFDTIDDAAQATREASQQTYRKADAISQREQTAWEAERDKAIEEEKDLVERHNNNIADFNANLGPDEKKMPYVDFDPSKVNVPERPMGYNDLKRDLDIAKAQSASQDAVARDEAYKVGIPKAQKALDNWFKQHDDEIPPAEYNSAKSLYSDSERFQEIANDLRAPINKNSLTGNTMRGLEAKMDNKMIRRGQQPGAFKRLLGPEGYENWSNVAKLFDPIKNAPQGMKAWGAYAVEYMAAHLVPFGIGIGGKATAEMILNKAMFDPAWGKALTQTAQELQHAAVNGSESERQGLPFRVSKALRDTVRGLIQNERGSMGTAVGSIPLTSEEELRHDANGYQALNNRPAIDHTPQSVSTRAKDIADEYQNLVHNPNDPEVQKSYNALKNDINDQWNYATQEMGIKFEPWTGEGQPYANSKEMIADARDNKHVYFFRGGEMPQDHPLAEVDPQTGLTMNDKFRAVHDLFGHAVGGNQFGPAGEESAWAAHSQMMSPEARPAMTTETRGQNSWVNSGQHLRDENGNIPAKGEQGYVPPQSRPYAEQKAGILPSWAHEPQSAPIDASHWSKTAGLTELDPEKFNDNGISPEAKRLAQFPEQSAKAAFLGTDKYKEREIQGRPHKYNAKLDASRYYDIEKDPQGLIEKAKNAAAEDGHFGEAAVMSYFDKEVRNAGYAGHIDPSGVVRSFEKVPVTKHEPPTSQQVREAWESMMPAKREPLNPDGTPNWPANYKPTQLSTEGGAGANYSAADLAKVKQQLGINGSGESAASREAINRQAAEQAQGVKRVVVDTRSGIARPLIGADAVDYQPKPYESVEFRGGDRDGEVINQGQSARPYTRQEERRATERQAPLNANEMEAAIKNRQPIQTPFDVTEGAMDTINKDVARRLAPVKDYNESEIATRRPTAAKAILDNAAGQHANAAAMDAAEADSPSGKTAAGKPTMGYKEKMARTLADYAGIKYSEAELKSPSKVINKFTNRVADNLVWLHDQVAPELRAKTKRWYDSAHTLLRNMGEQYGFSHEQAAGVTAALSPQNPWDNNLGLAKRMMDIYKNQQDHEYTPAMEKVAADLKSVPTQSKAFKALLNDIHGKTLSEIKDDNPSVQAAQKALWIRVYDEAHGSPENDLYSPDGKITGKSPDTRSWIGLDHAAKAVKILENGSVANINDVMGQGHKIRNFYNNLINPNSKAGHVTIDTHATAAAHLRPFGAKDLEAAHTFGSSLKGTPGAPRNAATGLKGVYPVYADAYQIAAARLGILPRELQSITWEAVKSLMGDEKKTPQLKQKVKDIWTDVQNGHLTPAKARELIKNEAGGFSKPQWMSDEEWERQVPDQGGDTSF